LGEYRPERAAVDIEGPFVNPKADFAWFTNEILSPETKKLFPLDLCKTYDGGYDDGRYFHELGRSTRHSTGMWPQLSLAIAAYDGKTDDDLIALARKTTKLNPGGDKLMKYLLKNFDAEVYPITSSYPAVALIIAKDLGIPFDQVTTNGFQPPQKHIHKPDFVDEVKQRSPMRILSQNRKELGKFLVPYVKTCEALAECYGMVPKDRIRAEEAIGALLSRHNDLFEDVNDSNLRSTLEYMLLTEEGVMGSHRKVDAMRRVHDDRRLWTYLGDSIVDAMPIEFADYGISINMKDRHALSFSKLNAATTDVSTMIPIFERMLYEDFNPVRLKGELDFEEIRVFTPHDIQKDIEKVIQANGEAKEKLKAMYVMPEIK